MDLTSFGRLFAGIANDGVKGVRRVISDIQNSGWEEAWTRDLPQYDPAEVQPPLRDLIVSGVLDLPRNRGKALVPGCGRGYDAIHIASSLGLDTLGIDIASTIILAANDLLYSAPAIREPGKVSFQTQDFFTMTVGDKERFDLVYDYTFFTYINPSRRLEWGRQITALTKPGAFLITLMYPLGLSPDEPGPPYYVTPEHYNEPLEGWTRIMDQVPRVSSHGHLGRERIVVWRKNTG